MTGAQLGRMGAPGRGGERVEVVGGGRGRSGGRRKRASARSRGALFSTSLRRPSDRPHPPSLRLNPRRTSGGPSGPIGAAPFYPRLPRAACCLGRARGVSGLPAASILATRLARIGRASAPTDHSAATTCLSFEEENAFTQLSATS